MAIRYLRNEEIDAKKWDACLSSSMPSLLYGYSWYLDLVCDHWDALILNDYEAVMPLPYTKKFGINFALQPPFCQQLGIFTPSAISEEMVKLFLAAIPAKFRWVKLHLNYCNKASYLSNLRANYVLDLIPDFNALKAKFESSIMRSINKSERSTCSILEGVDTASILDLIAYQNKEKNMGISPKSMLKLEKLIHSCTQKGVLMSIGFYSPVNHLCAIGLFLKDRQRLYYLVGASDAMGREYAGMSRILVHLIEKHASLPFTLDFEGSEIPGVANYFKKFAAQNSPYPTYSRKGFGILNQMIEKKLG